MIWDEVRIWSYIDIDYFGEINFGSLKENDFMDLYNSKEFTEIRKMHDKSKFPDNHLCKRCLLYSGE